MERINLTELGDAVYQMREIAMECEEEYRACIKAVEQGGNEKARPYADIISYKMMEAAQRMEWAARHIREQLENRDSIYLK